MRTSRRVGLGLLGVAWIALGVAAAGVVLTPTDWCGELPAPAGETTALAALIVGGAAAFVALFVALDSLVVVGIASAAFVAGGGVFWWLIHHTAAWGCG
jgi:hypothetical protein